MDIQNTTTRSTIGFGWVLPTIIAFILGLGTGYWVWGRPGANPGTQAALQSAQSTAAAAQQQVAAQQTTTAGQDSNQPDTQNIKRYAVSADDDPSQGPADAQITIIEFSDFECPYCRKWQVEVWPKVKEAYPGKVRLVYRDFPLYGLHANAPLAAEAANCAGEQNKYWEYHDRLFSTNTPYGRQLFDTFAQDIKLDMTRFKSCLDEHRFEKEVKADYDFASQLGIRSTPTFFINGIALVGAEPFETFKQIIDLELAGKIPKN